MKHYPLTHNDSSYRLYVGSQPEGRASVFDLQRHQIKTAVVLLENLDPVEKLYSMNGIENIIHFPIVDFSVPTDTKSVALLAYDINKALKEGNVYMHCQGGKGRTGTIAACLKINNDPSIKTANEAINYTRRLIPWSIETLEQEKFVAKFFSDLRGSPLKGPEDEFVILDEPIISLSYKL